MASGCVWSSTTSLSAALSFRGNLVAGWSSGGANEVRLRFFVGDFGLEGDE